MTYTMIGNIPVFGEPQANAVEQMQNCALATAYCALMADHHLGYALPVGGVAAYRGQVSPSGVGYDISCGNKAVLLDLRIDDVKPHIRTIMDEIWHTLSFGVGRVNDEPVEHELFDDDPAWDIEIAHTLRNLAQAQLGTIGSGNHYVDLFADEEGRVWCGVHFGSRGLGHRLATHFVKAGGGKDGINVAPVLFAEASQLGQEYIACMSLAGRYAYAGRDWVCEKVAEILGAAIVEEVHNHHNFAWLEEHHGERLWVVRKGATPAWPGQRGFIGGSMGDNAVIVEGVDGDESIVALRSTVHGAGRVMSRTQAAGKRKWVRGKPTRVSEGAVSRRMMHEWVDRKGVELRGAGTDESPHVYKRLPDVLQYHSPTIKIIHTLTPIGVAMAGEDEVDPYRD
jgi:tRNA-splicing ligase RtcB